MSAHLFPLIIFKFFFYPAQLLFFPFSWSIVPELPCFSCLASSQNYVLDPLEERLLTVKPFSF